MKIRIDPHTLERAQERGTNTEEIKEVIETGLPLDAKHRRSIKTKVYPFNQLRHGKFYEQKRVEVIYTTESDTFVTVTVYVFYGKWEEQK